MEMETTIFTCNSSLIILFSPRTLTVFGGKKPKKEHAAVSDRQANFCY